jgi:two-component system, OmpR family, alkaline phosphatase synthesis response regulator PhoP
MEKILFADDDVEIQVVVKSILTRAGYDTVIAKDGAEALHLAEETNPDLIVLDYVMPVMEGLETCKALKANPKTNHIPVIMVTAYASEKENSLAAGAVDFITKPVDKADLLLRIKSILKVRHIKNELQKIIAYLAELEK